MRKTQQQLEAEHNEAVALRAKRDQYPQQFTADTADRLGKAANGGYYTNPQVTAALGLSETKIDMSLVHRNSERQAQLAHLELKNRSDLVKGGTPTPTAKPNFTLYDLLQIDQREMATRHENIPDWWDEVDPGGYVRRISVPETIEKATDLLSLTQPQIVKLYLSKTPQEWQELTTKNVSKQYVDMEGKRIPGSFSPYEDLGAKFPKLKEIFDAEISSSARPNAWSLDSMAGSLTETFKSQLSGTAAALGVVPKIVSYAIPDSIGPVDIAGTVGQLSKPGKAVTRAVTTGLAAAAQYTKGTLEFAMTHPGALSSLGVQSLPIMDEETWDDYNNIVIKGNILSQIAMQAFRGEKIDIGSGFFPEGKAAEDARIAHDAGLPQIGGKTFTVGRAVAEPFIKEGYIDRNGYAANMLSGIVDGTFTGLTDPSLYGDPLRLLMDTYKLSRVAALGVLEGKAAEIVREAWAAERRAAGLSDDIGDIVNISPGIDVLPRGTMLPRDVQMAAEELAQQAIGGQTLKALDMPPSPKYLSPSGSRVAIRENMGIIDQADGTMRINPMNIDYMPFYADGRRALEKLSSFDNVGQLYDAFLGNVPIGAAVKIQEIVDVAKAAGKAVDLKEVHKVLREAVFSGDPLYNVREVPGVLKPIIQQTGTQIAQWSSGRTRQFATMPQSTFFSFEDPIASVNDANRLMTIMKVPKKEKYEMLSDLIKASVNGETSRRFELADKFQKTIIAPALRKNGVPEEWIDDVAKWSGWNDGVEQWSMDAIGQAYPTPWFDDGTGEVIRMNDFMAKGFMMVAPENLQQVIRETTNLWKVFKPFRESGDSRINKLLQPALIERLQKIQTGYLKPIALGAPLPIRMVTRILPDEMLRIAATQSFGIDTFKVWGAYGYVNYNTAGDLLISGKEVHKLIPIADHLETLYSKLRNEMNLAAIGETNTVSQTQKLIDALEKKYGTRQEILKQIGVFENRATESLPGTGRKLTELAEGLMAKDRLDPRIARYERSNITEAAFKDVDINGAVINPNSKVNQNWVTGTSRDIVSMSEDPIYREVAKTLLAGGKAAIDQLPERFLNGDLKPLFDRYYKKVLKAQGADAMSTMFPLTQIDGNTQWVATIYSDITTRVANDPKLIETIATGELDGQRIAAKLSWADKTSTSRHIYEATEEFKLWVKQNLLTNPESAKAAPFNRIEMQAQQAMKSNFLTKNFNLYRDVSAKYARGPLEQYMKWKRIQELMPAMDPAEAQKMVDAIGASDAPEFLKESLAAQLPFAQGTATRKQVEILGTMYGDKFMSDVLYDSAKKSYFGARHSLLFGFFDAWREQWSVWMRQMATQPTLLEKARLAKEGLTGAELPSWAGGEPGRGIIYTDEDTNQQAVALPFSREVYRMLGLNAQEQISTKNLTLLGSAVPGFFGLGAMVMDSVLPKNEAFAATRSLVFPFGDPAVRSNLADYLVPAWGQGLIASGASLARGGTEFDLITNLQAMFATEQNDSIRATTLNAVLTNIASNSSNTPLTIEERNTLLDNTQTKADVALALKSFFKIMLPGASMTKYYTDLGSENVTSGAVMDDLRAITDKRMEAGGTYADGVLEFLTKYGNDAWIYLAGSTKSLPGMQATKEFAEWNRKNSDLLDKYPLVAGYLGPQEGEYDPKAYGEQRAVGKRTPKELKKRQDDALNGLAWTVYNNAKDSLLARGREQGLTPQQTMRSETYTSEMKQTSEGLKQQFPMWDSKANAREMDAKNQLRQISEMVLDPKITKLPAGEALKKYWDYRTAYIAQAIKDNPALANESWKTVKASLDMRADLTTTGAALAVKYPEFLGLWENVLSREFDPIEIGM